MISSVLLSLAPYLQSPLLDRKTGWLAPGGRVGITENLLGVNLMLQYRGEATLGGRGLCQAHKILQFLRHPSFIH